MLTKSLHTVTAATNVARLILLSARDGRFDNPTASWTLAHAALKALGYDIPVASAEATDETVRRIREACGKLLAEKPITRRDVADFERVHGPIGAL